jgi:hypothetical protein
MTCSSARSREGAALDGPGPVAWLRERRAVPPMTLKRWAQGAQSCGAALLAPIRTAELPPRSPLTGSAFPASYRALRSGDPAPGGWSARSRPAARHRGHRLEFGQTWTQRSARPVSGRIGHHQRAQPGSAGFVTTGPAAGQIVQSAWYVPTRPTRRWFPCGPGRVRVFA